MDKVYIYGLYTSIDDRVRYVGKSINPENRLKDHIKEAKEGKHSHYPKNRWILKNIKKGVEIKYKIIDTCDIEKWKEKEKEWIKFYRENSNYEILNLDDGGYGYESKGLLNYEECKKWVNENYKGVKSQCGWKEYIKENKLPYFIPRNPSATYSVNGGFSWFDFFMKSGVNKYLIEKYTFDELKEKLKNVKGIYEIKDIEKYREEKKDYKIPKKIKEYYSSRGYDVRKLLKIKYVNYDVFKRYIKMYFPCVNSVSTFSKNHHKMNKRIPFYIKSVYKNDYDNFLFMMNNGEFIYKNKKFYSFEMWKKKIIEYDINNKKDYLEKRKKDKFMPKEPERVYKEWTSSYDIFKNDKSIRYNLKIDTFRRYMNVYHKGIKSSSQYKKMFSTKKISKKIPKRPDIYFGTKWKNLAIW